MIQKSHYLLISIIFLWFVPFTNALINSVDNFTFIFLNSSLEISKYWQFVWLALNHKNESIINVFVMLFINGIVIYQSKDRKKAIKNTLYFWLCFQFVLLANSIIFRKILDIQRLSPSLIIQPTVTLSEIFTNTPIKESSVVCFPAGHALVAAYWGCFTAKMTSNKTTSLVIITTTFLLCVSRLFTGAHWLSDIIFTVLLGIIWFRIFDYLKNK